MTTVRFLYFVILCFFFIPLGTSAQDQKKSPFVIKGSLTHADGQKFSLFNADDNKKVDQATEKDGTFLLKGTASDPTVFALKLKGNEMPMLLVLGEKDSLNLHIDIDSFPIARVSGNRQSLQMQEYQKEFVPLIRQANDINNRVRELSSDDTAAALAIQEEAKAFNDRIKATGEAYVQYHPEAIASIFVLMNELNNIQPSKLRALFSSLSEEVQSSKYGQMAQAAINRVAATAIGAPAPNFTQKDPEGDPVSLASFRGKYVLVDFWASWCGPCRAENPNVVRTYQKFRDRNFTILGVSLDKSKKSWEDAIQQDHLFWTQVSDLQGWNNDAAQLYHVYSIPANFLIGPEGKIIAKNLRGEALENTLNSLFK